MPADTLYNNAQRDRLGGKLDLAMQEFQQYLQYYPQTDLAPNAQYYIAEIHFSQGDLESALKEFDLVLEKYPDNSKTPDALYMKGQTLVKLGRRTQGGQEFQELIKRFPAHDLSKKACSQLQTMGLQVRARRPAPPPEKPPPAASSPDPSPEQSCQYSSGGNPMEPDLYPPIVTYEDAAKMIDHSLVRPELTDEQVIEGCELARRYSVATVSVRPCDVETAVRALEGSGVKVGSVAGFPHGSTTTAVKLYEARDVLRRGAREIDMVINVAKLLSRQFQHVEMELLQMAETCHTQGAILKVILENAYLPDELKIIACRICSRAGVDFAKTSTGFAPGGYTIEDVRLMRKHLAQEVGVKAAGGVRTLEKLKEVRAAGATRIGATATAAILDAWKEELKRAAEAAKQVARLQ